jgi:hypothetical protein
LLEALQNDRRSADSKWLLAQYRLAHDAISPGTPPLTGQMLNAAAEAMAFVFSEVIQQPIVADTLWKDVTIDVLKRRWPTMSPEDQQSLADVPSYWVLLRTEWGSFTREARERHRRGWAEWLGPASVAKFRVYSVLQNFGQELDAIFDSAGQRPLQPHEWKAVVAKLESLVVMLRKEPAGVPQDLLPRLEKAASICRKKAIAASASSVGSTSTTSSDFPDTAHSAARFQVMSGIITQQNYALMGIPYNRGGAVYRMGR